MTEETEDLAVRLAAFEWLREQVAIHGDVLPRRLLADGFVHRGEQIHLVGPQGIFKPRALVVGLKEIHGQRIQLPRAPRDRPDVARLERRYERFLRAS